MTAAMIAPQSREAVVLDERRAIPRAWREAALNRSGGTCAYPGCEATGPLEYDHIIALALGGKHRADNIEPLCVPHHRIKTNRDLRMIAKAKRAAGETGQRARREKRGGGSIPAHKNPWPKTKRPLKSRGFEPSRPQGATNG